jgi:outer membrane receptor protein involved in Fe transport
MPGKVEIDWKPTLDVMLYAEIARGTKGPGFNGMPTG